MIFLDLSFCFIHRGPFQVLWEKAPVLNKEKNAAFWLFGDFFRSVNC